MAGQVVGAADDRVDLARPGIREHSLELWAALLAAAQAVADVPVGDRDVIFIGESLDHLPLDR